MAGLPVVAARVPAGLAVGAGNARPAVGGGPAVAGCPVGGVEVDLAGSGDTAVVTGHAAAACRAAAWGSRPVRNSPRSYWTYEIACSPDHLRGGQGLCSATPCKGRFFAFRTLHRPDGGTEPAGYSCVSLDRAAASPALTAADVFAAVRRVKLPPGAIHIAPSGRGLANLPSRLWLVGDALGPVNLRLAGSTVRAAFQPVQYHWTIRPGDGRQVAGGRAAGRSSGGTWTVPATAGSSGRDGEAVIEFPGRGDFVVSVVTTWSATAFLDGRYVGQIEGLESTARITYPVAELLTALTG
jgi:hypothetical protein